MEELSKFEDMDLKTGNSLVVVVYNPDHDYVEIENPQGLPYPMVLGLLHSALDQWTMDGDFPFDDDE